MRMFLAFERKHMLCSNTCGRQQTASHSFGEFRGRPHKFRGHPHKFRGVSGRSLLGHFWATNLSIEHVGQHFNTFRQICSNFFAILAICWLFQIRQRTWSFWIIVQTAACVSGPGRGKQLSTGSALPSTKLQSNVQGTIN